MKHDYDSAWVEYNTRQIDADRRATLRRFGAWVLLGLACWLLAGVALALVVA